MNLLGLDIGGSGIKGAIVDSTTGDLLSERKRVDTPQPATPENVASAVKELIDDFDWQGPVGCSFPTVVLDGKCLAYGNLSPEWLGVQADTLFSEHCGGLPFYVGNDADLAGLAEMELGAGKGALGKVIMVTIGTGIGSGFFYNGELIPNFELGRIYHRNGDIIERYASDAARKRHDLKLNKWAKRFDFFLNYVDRCFSPNLFILGGGISKKFDRFEDRLTCKVPVKVAKFLNNAGIIGAAMFAYRGSQKME